MQRACTVRETTVRTIRSSIGKVEEFPLNSKKPHTRGEGGMCCTWLCCNGNEETEEGKNRDATNNRKDKNQTQ